MSPKHLVVWEASHLLTGDKPVENKARLTPEFWGGEYHIPFWGVNLIILQEDEKTPVDSW